METCILKQYVAEQITTPMSLIYTTMFMVLFAFNYATGDPTFPPDFSEVYLLDHRQAYEIRIDMSSFARSSAEPRRGKGNQSNGNCCVRINLTCNNVL